MGTILAACGLRADNAVNDQLGFFMRCLMIKFWQNDKKFYITFLVV